MAELDKITMHVTQEQFQQLPDVFKRIADLEPERDSLIEKVASAWEEGRMAGWYSHTEASENPYL